MKGYFSSFGLKASLLAFACVLLAIAVVVVILYPREKILNSLLVDLELKGPDPGRYAELVEVFTRGFRDEAFPGKTVRTRLSYIHYREFTAGLVKQQSPDFILLSPQSTPWHMYRDDAAVKLGEAKSVLKDLIIKDQMPVLGICGGHQFLAMAFGGAVDFIDSRLMGTFPERYPKEATSERGMAYLETLRRDPIFSGVAIHPGKFAVMESHYEEVKTIPEPFVNLARSPLSEAQLISIPGMIVYGMAFHPERSGKSPGTKCEEGRLLLRNFVRMVAERR